jgi:hypothetical protein
MVHRSRSAEDITMTVRVKKAEERRVTRLARRLRINFEEAWWLVVAVGLAASRQPRRFAS